MFDTDEYIVPLLSDDRALQRHARSEIEREALRRIPDLVFGCESPIQEFSGDVLANVDTPLLLARTLRRVLPGVLLTDSIVPILTGGGAPFAYVLAMEGREVRLVAALNPVHGPKSERIASRLRVLTAHRPLACEDR